MEGRAETVVLQFSIYFLLCLFQIGSGSSQCLDNIPQYWSNGWKEHYSNTQSVIQPHLSDEYSYIIPEYAFSCYGKVTQWRVRVEQGDNYEMALIVYRPSDDPRFPNCYSKVGSNSIKDGTAINSSITLSVSKSDQISVEPGDVVGVYHRNGNRIEADVTDISITVWFSGDSNIEFLSPSCQYRPGPGGNFNSLIAAAPVITAVVAPSSTFIPSSSHFTSTPSPSTIPSPSSPTPSLLTQDGGSILSIKIIAGIAAGAVGGVIVIIILILLIILSILKTRATSTDEKMNEIKTYLPTRTIPMVQSQAYNVIVETRNSTNRSATNAIAMQQNEAYDSVTVGVAMN